MIRPAIAAMLTALALLQVVPAVADGLRGVTPLMQAVEKDDAARVEALLASGADPDARDERGDTALNRAAHYGHFACARLLLDAGADPRLAGHGNALEISLRRGHEEMIQVLSVAMGTRTAPNRHATMLMVAVLQDDPEGVRQAIDDGADPDAHDGVGRPLLHAAARVGHASALAELLTGGATVDALDPIGFTALMVAARESRADLVDALIAAGADVNHRAAERGNRLTPLHLAAIGGDPVIVGRLAAAGADIDARCLDGATPADWATIEGNTDCAAALSDLTHRN